MCWSSEWSNVFLSAATAASTTLGCFHRNTPPVRLLPTRPRQTVPSRRVRRGQDHPVWVTLEMSEMSHGMVEGFFTASKSAPSAQVRWFNKIGAVPPNPPTVARQLPSSPNWHPLALGDRTTWFFHLFEVFSVFGSCLKTAGFACACCMSQHLELAKRRVQTGLYRPKAWGFFGRRISFRVFETVLVASSPRCDPHDGPDPRGGRGGAFQRWPPS